MSNSEEMLYVKMRGRVIGPFDADRLKQMAKMGQLSRTHMLSTDAENWQRASEFPELFLTSSGSNPTVSTSAVTESSAPAIEKHNQMTSEAVNEPTWHYTMSGQQIGPVATAELRELIAAARLGPFDLVWQDGMDDWATIDSIPQLASLLQQSNVLQSGNPHNLHVQNPNVHAQYQNPNVHTQQTDMQIRQTYSPSKRSSNGLISAGYICGGLSLICCPPFLGLAAVILGIINLTKGSVGHGIAQICLGLFFGIAGSILGAILMSMQGL